jgi:hypothetical protein
MVVVAGLGVWSVRRDPATVADQRDIVVAVDDLQRVAGVLYAAAGGDGRAVVLGGLNILPGCSITAVRPGVTANRDVTVYVRPGEARAVLEDIAVGLPGEFRAGVIDLKAGTRLSLHADAGNFVGIDSEAEATATVLTVRVSTGCRPRDEDWPDRADPAAGAAPGVLSTVVGALGGPAPQPIVQAVACPDGGSAGTYTALGVATPADLGERMRAVSAGGQLLRQDASAWAYRTGDVSVVVVPDEKHLRISVSTAC